MDQISEKERGKARNRSASAKWAGNRGESSSHLRVKWTVDNINRAAVPPPLERNARRKMSNDTFYPRISPSQQPPISVFLRISLSLSSSSSSSLLFRTTPHRERILREEFSATRSRWYPEGNLLTRSKFSSRKSFEKSHPEFKGKPFI